MSGTFLLTEMIRQLADHFCFRLSGRIGGKNCFLVIWGLEWTTTSHGKNKGKSNPVYFKRRPTDRSLRSDNRPARPTNKTLSAGKFFHKFILVRIADIGFQTLGKKNLALSRIPGYMIEIYQVGVMDSEKILILKEAVEVFEVF